MLYMLLLLSLILCCVAATQNSGFAQAAAPTAITAPGLPPLPPTPVDTFRRILSMSQADREKFLATLTPEKRQVVTRKLEEYQALAADEREARLRALQVRVCVRQMIRLSPSNRVERLTLLAPAERKEVQIRLAEWDQLPPDLQKEVLANEIAIHHIARSPDFMFDKALPPFPTDKKFEAELKDWLALPEPKRAEILSRFQYFFEDLSERERAKVMTDRPEMAKAVPINRLAKEQRDRYLHGFKRFVALTPAGRQRFLINASHWQNLTPQQRESWRTIAKKLTPSGPPPPVPSRPSVSISAPSNERAALDFSADPASR